MAATIGTNIREARTAAGHKTQDGFAKALGWPQPRLNDLEQDRAKWPTLRRLLPVAKFLGCSVDQFLKGVDAEYDAALLRYNTSQIQETKPSSVPKTRIDTPREMYDAATMSAANDLRGVGGEGEGPGASNANDSTRTFGVPQDPAERKRFGQSLIVAATYLRELGNKLVTDEGGDSGSALPGGAGRSDGPHGPVSEDHPKKKSGGE